MATGDFDMTAVIEADRLSRKEWEAAISQATSVHFPGCLCERCIGIRADVAYPQAADDPEDRQGRQLDEAIGFVPMSPKPAPEPPSPPPIPARALRYGVAEAPLLEWPE